MLIWYLTNPSWFGEWIKSVLWNYNSQSVHVKNRYWALFCFACLFVFRTYFFSKTFVFAEKLKIFAIDWSAADIETYMQSIEKRFGEKEKEAWLEKRTGSIQSGERWVAINMKEREREREREREKEGETTRLWKDSEMKTVRNNKERTKHIEKHEQDWRGKNVCPWVATSGLIDPEWPDTKTRKWQKIE